MLNPSLSDEGASPHTEAGNFWLRAEEAASLRVVEFAGLPVAGDALVLPLPSGGELAVWPDGRYEFTGSDGDLAGTVSTHYSYVAEAADGTLVSGSFSLGEHLAAESLPDFQGWSLDDILALDDMLGHAAGPPVSADGGPASGLSADMGLADASGDILDHMLHGTFES